MAGGGLIGRGQAYNAQTQQMWQGLAEQEQHRNAANAQIQASDRSETMSAMGTGAGLGFMVGGPVGAGIGAIAGLALGELF